MPILHQVTSVSFTFCKFVEPFCFYLSRLGVTIHASFTPDGSESSLPCYLSYFPISVARSTKLRDLYLSLRSLRDLISTKNPAAFHVHTPIASYFLRFLLFFSFRKTKVLYTVHGFYFHENSSFFSFLFHFAVEYFLSFRTNLMLFVSYQDYLFARRYFFLTTAKMIYVPNSVDTSVFCPPVHVSRSLSRESFGFSSTDFVVGYVGRLVVEKGINYLVTAFRKLLFLYPCAKLLIVGSALDSDYDSFLGEELSRLVSDYPSSVVTTGLLHSPTEILSAYHSMDCFCLPSLREGLPLSLIEAMACGLPCVATDIRGCNELIDHGCNGLLVPIHSHASLTSAFSRLIHDRSFACSLSEQARTTILKRYDNDYVYPVQFSAIMSILDDV